MKNSLIRISFLLFVVLGLLSLTNSFKNQLSVYNNEKDLLKSSVQDILISLGDDKPIHYLEKENQDSVKMGYELVHFGRLKDKSNKRISKFFVCTDCHNQVKEVDDLANETAAERLKYGMENNLPFLPASTFYGQYNKIHWYNGDYSKKYGNLVVPTRDSLENAIQLCAVQCSQGRPLVKWELRSIVHYYKSIEMKMEDLKFTPQEMLDIMNDLATNNKRSISVIKSKYSNINPATFGDPYKHIEDTSKGNVKNGEYIFKNGCLHCHGMGKDITAFEFNADKLTFSFLESKLKKHSDYTVPYIVRKGTYATSGKRQYMPQYPLEKMNESHLIDLIQYIKTQSK